MGTRLGRTIRKNIFTILNLDRKMKKIIKKNEMSHTERYRFAMRFVDMYHRDMKVNVITTGVENIDKENTKGCLLVGNHQGKSDAISIMHALNDFATSFVIADKASHGFFFGTVCDAMGAKRIKFDDLRSQVLVYNEIVKELNEGKRFIVFPEAGYGDNRNELQEFHTPCFQTAIKAKCPIIPICLYDTWKVYHEDFQNRKVLDVYCHILKPIQYEDYKHLDKKGLCNLVKETIQAKLDEINNKED